MRKFSKKMLAIFSALLVILTVVPSNEAQAYRDSVVEITNSYTAGKQVRVPVKLHNLDNLNSGSLQVTLSEDGFTFKDFRPTPKFKNGLFTTTYNQDGDQLNISILAKKTGAEYDIESTVLGYITYEIESSVSLGKQVQVKLSNVAFKDAGGEGLVEKTFDGILSHVRSMGDVKNNHTMNAAQALKILQHANGSSKLANEDQPYADINGDGNIGQNDAQELLNFIAGKKQSLLSIQTKKLNPAFLETPYKGKLKANFGNEPYTWSAESRMPSGLSLNEETGEITGTPRYKGENTITITVEDRTGTTASRTFDLSVTESTVKQIETLAPVSVKVGETPTLPANVKVTYKDGTTSFEYVEWDKVDTSVIGEYTVSGFIDNIDMNTSVEVVVYEGDEEPYIPEKQIVGVTTDYVGFVDVHTIVVEVTDQVARMEVVGENSSSREVTIPMLADKNSTFSLATERFVSGQVVTVVAYDYYDEKITEKQITLK